MAVDRFHVKRGDLYLAQVSKHNASWDSPIKALVFNQDDLNGPVLRRWLDGCEIIKLPEPDFVIDWSYG